MAPLGKRDQPARADFDVEYQDVDLVGVDRLLSRCKGFGWPAARRVATSSSGRSAGIAERFGSGSATFVSTSGASLQGPQTCRGCAPPRRGRDTWCRGRSATTRRSSRCRSSGDARPIPSIRGRSFFEPSRIYTPIPTSRSKARPRTASDSKMPFHVTSANWQESDRLLAGLMTAFGSPTRAIQMDGAGDFDGVLLGAFRRPRIEGRFPGREMRAFDVTWGDVEGDVVVENSYANVSRAVIQRGRSRMDVSGLFSLGYPRARRRRGDQRPHSHRPIARWSICSKRSTSRTTTSTACCRATSTSTAPTRGRSGSAA